MSITTTVLVTGGAGFIGSAVIRHLLDATDLKIINLDKLTYASHSEDHENAGHQGRYIFEQADICDRLAVETILHRYRPDAIIHLAAESHVDTSITAPAAFVMTNIVGTYTLLEAARTYWSQLDADKQRRFRFHHVSTDEVFGDLSDQPSGHDAPFTEDSRYQPSNPYSATKASADHLVRAWYRTYGLPVVISNCSNNYGPYQFPEKFIPLAIRRALQGQPIPVYGAGQQIRDWLYVEDHARALLAILREGRTGETYNIGGHNELTNMEVVETICQILENKAPEKPDGVLQYRDLITLVRDRPGHDHRYAIDASKVQSELGWRPRETFETGLDKTIQWYLEHPLWHPGQKKGLDQ